MTEECKKAKLRALHILTRMDKTERDLKAGLEKVGFSVEAVSAALEYVKSYGYLDDQRYAQKYVEYNKERKSKKKIWYELLKKGVDSNYIEAALNECEGYDELAVARKFLRKRWNMDKKPDEKELGKLFASLSRQGFSSHDIWMILREENLT